MEPLSGHNSRGGENLAWPSAPQRALIAWGLRPEPPPGPPEGLTVQLVSFNKKKKKRSELNKSRLNSRDARHGHPRPRALCVLPQPPPRAPPVGGPPGQKWAGHQHAEVHSASGGARRSAACEARGAAAGGCEGAALTPQDARRLGGARPAPRPATQHQLSLASMQLTCRGGGAGSGEGPPGPAPALDLQGEGQWTGV